MAVTIDFGNFWEMLSALGTLGAVIVSLYLSMNKRKPKFHISFYTETNMTANESEVIFEIVNVWDVPAKIIDEGVTTSKINFFGKSTNFEGVIHYESSNDFNGSRYSNMVLIGETLTIKIDKKDLEKTLVNLLNKEKKFYFYVVDHNLNTHYLLLNLACE